MKIKMLSNFILSCMILMLSSFLAEAKMRSMDDDELSQVTAQAGVTIMANTQVRFKADNIKFSDSDLADQKWLELRGFSIHNDGGAYSVNTPEDSPITIDVASNSGRTYMDINLTHYTEPRSYRVDSLVFCDQDLGSLDINNVTLSTNHWRLGSRIGGETGIDWDYAMKMDIESIKYMYSPGGAIIPAIPAIPGIPASGGNPAVPAVPGVPASVTPEAALTLSGIHFAGNASGAPEDPGSWSFDGDFKFGDLDDKPATFDIGTKDSGETMVRIGLPMQGSIRVENVTFGEASFGPCAIDGINVHRLSIGMAN